MYSTDVVVGSISVSDAFSLPSRATSSALATDGASQENESGAVARLSVSESLPESSVRREESNSVVGLVGDKSGSSMMMLGTSTSIEIGTGLGALSGGKSLDAVPFDTAKSIVS